ncbi:MAG: radical SAM protein [Candidatus Omnitrophica bacterium]|nr:radical SAM protein [Candidatus Omnitrophota bacterium]
MDCKFLFIEPGSYSLGLNKATLFPPLGLVYLATNLNDRGFSAQIYDASIKRSTPQETLAIVKQKKPEVIGLRMYYCNIDWVKELIKLVRNLDSGIIVGIGGPCASTEPKATINKTGADFCMAGEGEFAILELAKNIYALRPYYEDVPGIMARTNNNGYYSGSPNNRIKDIDRIPFPDYDLVGGLDPYSPRTRYSPAAPIITTRGCAFKCSFCARHVFGNLVTYRSAENVIQEIVLLKQKYGIRQIDILDDNFTVDRNHAQRILDLIIKEKIGLSFDLRSGVRLESLDNELLIKMRKAGFYKIAFGIESADKRVLELCNKRLDLDKLRKTALFAKDIGFKTSGFFIIGLPGETFQSVRKTVGLAHELKLDVANFCMATPYPGTELFDYVKKHGRFLFDPEKNYDFGFYAGKPFYALPDLDEKEVSRRFSFAYRNFYNIFQILTDLFSIRTVAELKWFAGAALSVLKGQLYNLFKLTQVKHIDNINTLETFELHRRIIRQKPFLKKVYRDWYKMLKDSINGLSRGTIIELGSGGGFLKEVIPQAYTSDIVLMPGLDLNLSALDLPFKNNSISAFLMLDTMHHINKPVVFFKELSRCLRGGGRIIMIEPANTLWSRFIFVNFHQEDFDVSAGWEFETSGPLSSANGALPWIVFSRDRDIFLKEFPQLKIKRLRYHTPLRYILSGGLSMRQIAPSFTYGFFGVLEFLISPLNKYLGMFLLVEIEKCANTD